MEEPVNKFVTPGAITMAIPVGMFFNPLRTGREEIDRLGAETVALTHGAPQAFLAGGVLAHMISRIIWDGVRDLKELVKESVEALQEGFGREYRQVNEVRDGLNMALRLAASHNVSCSEAMEHLRCTTASEVLAGAVYAALCYENNFDEAMITAVNHSGRSAAVGAVTGAILGARLGEEAIPEFYLEPLEPVELLRELADDMLQGCPMELGNGLFDDDWDRKYIHGGRD
jgi:ADP-ribosylglycohydrolase